MKTAEDVLTEKGITYFDMNNQMVFEDILTAMDEHAEQFKINKLYEFVYNEMTEESSYATISIHRTREGAEKAMNEHKEKERLKFEQQNQRLIKEWKEEYSDNDVAALTESIGEFGRFKDWGINEIEILD